MNYRDLAKDAAIFLHTKYDKTAASVEEVFTEEASDVLHTSENTNSLLIDQYYHELGNFNAYKHYAQVCNIKWNYSGCEKFFNAQAQGELQHASWVEEFLKARKINIPKREIPSNAHIADPELIELWKDVYALEVGTTARLKRIHMSMLSSGDTIGINLMNKMLEEQIEEEDTVQTQMELFERAGDNFAAILILDDKLGV